MTDLISVIVPVFKVENYLNRCVDSILNQTYTNFELILVDDGSPDRCGQICDDYANKDSRVKVIHKENGGLSDARNAGIDIAVGEYYTFVDSDDWAHTDYLSILYYLLKDTSADISVCSYIRTDNEKVKCDLNNTQIYELTNLEALEFLCNSFYRQMVTAWGKLYHKSLFSDIRFPVGKIHEDEFITYKLLYKAKKIALTTKQLLYYWQRPDSIMGALSKSKGIIFALQAYQERAVFFNNEGLYNLRDLTNKKLFYMYRDYIESYRKSNQPINEEIVKEYMELRRHLREGKFTIKFKLGYEVYYTFPFIFNILYKLYIKAVKRI